MLALILVYIGVGGAEVLEAWRAISSRALSAICMYLSNTLLLLWVLYRNIYPVPIYP